ncbi:MAG: methyltransferase domain-containing protein [Nitrososphaerota archaeon]|nr:methyltransferase domain-containing protein [Nitrososphaerota archaeon]
MYGELAEYYNRIYHWKDYRKEAQKIKKLVREHKRSPGNRLLDVACGTGRHIAFLRKDFECVGLDASEELLKVARRDVPGPEFHRGDMTDFSLGRRFDVVLCLFSSTGYIRTKNEIRRATLNFAKHMAEGGVLIIEPWFRKSEWREKTVHLQTYDAESLKIARASFATSDGAFSVADEWYLIGKEGIGLRLVKDHHRMRFFEPELWLGALRAAGLDPRFTKDGLMRGRGLIIATRPAERGAPEGAMSPTHNNRPTTT